MAWKPDGQAIAQFGFGRIGLLGFPVAHQLHAAHQADAADDADHLVLLLQLFEAVQQVGTHLRRVFDEVLVLHDLDVAEGGRSHHRMTTKGDDVAEGDTLAAHESVGDVLASDGTAHGQVATGNALGNGHDVGGDAPVLAGEHLAGATEAGYHLIGDEQDAVLVADFAQHWPIVVRRHHRSHGTGNRLGDDARDRIRSLELDHVLDGPHAALAALLGGLATELAAVEVGLRHVERAGHQGLIVSPWIEMVPTEGHGSSGCAVIGILAADELDAAGLADPLEIGAGQLDGCLDGLRAAAGKEGTGQVAGRDLGNLFGEPDGGLGGGAHGHVGQLEHLLISGVGDFLPAIAHVLQPEAGHCVDGRVSL